jgi:predicted metal-dependent phosphotriesterase family hydrolase
MAIVETVRGPVELDRLGQTLMHEHVFVLSTEHAGRRRRLGQRGAALSGWAGADRP